MFDSLGLADFKTRVKASLLTSWWTLPFGLSLFYLSHLFFHGLALWLRSRWTGRPARGRVGRVTDCVVRGLGFKSPGSILTSRTEKCSLFGVVRDGWDP